MHAIEKILARGSGQTIVRTGEIVTAKVDFAEINDLYLQTIYSFREIGATHVWDPGRAAFVFDHYSPCPTIRTASNHREMRDFAKEQGLKYHFDVNAGVCHQVMPEAGLIYPGMIVVATDSHTTTQGAFGALAQAAVPRTWPASWRPVSCGSGYRRSSRSGWTVRLSQGCFPRMSH